MAKQIYIDENGNEVLVSGTITNDNNLPHYTGTPTAGSTAYEIEGVKTTLDEQTDITNPLFKIKNYESSSLTIPANGALNVTANQMGITAISGYTPIALVGWYTGSNDTFARSIEITATGTSSFCVLRNVGSSAYTGTYQVKILYVKTAYQKTVT